MKRFQIGPSMYKKDGYSNSRVVVVVVVFAIKYFKRIEGTYHRVYGLHTMHK